ncbi:MAG: plasminogen-binding N-terminal domain-containing protein, partial [Campylobacterales bacterium]
AESTITAVLPEGKIVLDTPSSSGLVVRTFPSGHRLIIAEAFSTGEGNRTIMRWRPYTALTNTSMPSIKPEPKVGDQLVQAPYRHRAIIIAPTLKHYQESAQAHPNLELVHPDLFAAALNKEGEPIPKRSHFEKFCSAYGIGVVVFALEGHETTVACPSFEHLQIRTTQIKSDANETIKPFFHRLGEIKRGLFDFGSSDIGLFTPYYDQLIGAR